MVFMDTTTTIVTGSCCERWKYAAFIISTFFLGAFTYPLFANWAWGGGWLANLGTNFGLGKGYAILLDRESCIRWAESPHWPSQ